MSSDAWCRQEGRGKKEKGREEGRTEGRKGGRNRRRKTSILTLTTWWQLEWIWLHLGLTREKGVRCINMQTRKGKHRPRLLFYMFYAACEISGDILTTLSVHLRDSFQRSICTVILVPEPHTHDIMRFPKLLVLQNKKRKYLRCELQW